MAVIEKRIDEYIDKAAPFAQPILRHIRALVHKTCPDVEEKIKWGMPHFDYKGEMMCSMASFKQHAVAGFWKAALMEDKILLQNAKAETAMGHLGRITSLKDLPPDKTFCKWIKEAMILNEKGIKLPAKNNTNLKPNLELPDYFTQALAKDKKAQKVFESFSYSHKKEYLEWITSAKTELTRHKRLAAAIEMMAASKHLNWKYDK